MKKQQKKKNGDWVDQANNRQTRSNDDLRSKDVAHIFDCSPDDVIELARKGVLEARKEGRLWKFRKSDVLKYKRSIDAFEKKAV